MILRVGSDFWHDVCILNNAMLLHYDFPFSTWNKISFIIGCQYHPKIMTLLAKRPTIVGWFPCNNYWCFLLRICGSDLVIFRSGNLSYHWCCRPLLRLNWRIYTSKALVSWTPLQNSRRWHGNTESHLSMRSVPWKVWWGWPSLHSLQDVTPRAVQQLHWPTIWAIWQSSRSFAYVATRNLARASSSHLPPWQGVSALQLLHQYRVVPKTHASQCSNWDKPQE